jgi:hypothetical protein
MADNTRMPGAFHAFLRGEAGLALLRRCAAAILKWMRDKDIPGTVVGCDDLDDLAGGIMVFILERDGLRQELEEAASIGNPTALSNLIILSFRRHIQDLRRAGRGNAWYALYRKIVRLLNAHPDFTTIGNSEGTWYAPKQGADPPCLNQITLQPEQGHTDWPFPTWDHAADLEGNLAVAADQFWRAAVTKSHDPGLVAVRDLLGWLAGKGVVDVRARETVLESDLPENGPRLLDEMAVAAPTSPPLQRDALARLARRIVAAWKPDMARAFYLVHGKGLRQVEAARTMGYASAAGVNYPLRQAALDLRKMVAAWTELFEEGDEQTQEVFLECVLAECKARITKDPGRK